MTEQRSNATEQPERPYIEGSGASTGSPRQPQYSTPLRPDQVTVDRTAQAVGLTPDQVAPKDSRGSLLSDGMSADEREDRGIIDESRHVDGMGRR